METLVPFISEKRTKLVVFLILNFLWQVTSLSQNCEEPVPCTSRSRSAIPGPVLIQGITSNAYIRTVDYMNIADPLNYSDFEIILHDDFDLINSDVWELEAGSSYTNSWVPGSYPFTLDLKTGDNVSIANGLLHLTARSETPAVWGKIIPWAAEAEYIPEDNMTNGRYFSWTGGGILSKRRFTHGLFEARIRIPPANGIWAAYWLWSNAYCEIDIFEFGQRPVENIVNGITLYEIESPDSANRHLFSSYHNYFFPQSQRSNLYDFYCPEGFHNEFHLFSLLWNEYMMVFYLDHKPYKYIFHYYKYYLTEDQSVPVINQDDLLSWINAYGSIYVNESFPKSASRIWLSLGVTNTAMNYYPNGGSIVDEEVMLVDYVSYYGLKSCGNNIEIKNTGLITERTYDCVEGGVNWLHNTYENSVRSLPSYISGGQIVLGGATDNSKCIINNYDQGTACFRDLGGLGNVDHIEVQASSRIILKSGFHAQKGSTFHATVKPCQTNKTMSYNPPLASADIDADGAGFIESAKQPTSVKLSIFPNPTNGDFFVKGEDVVLVRNMSVFDLQGNCIYTQSLTSKDFHIFRMNFLPCGVYLIQFILEDSSTYLKLVIQK